MRILSIPLALFLLALCALIGCSGASFDVAEPLTIDTSGGDSGASDAPSDVLPPDAAPDTSPDVVRADTRAETGDGDAGGGTLDTSADACPLFDHFDPVLGVHYKSCAASATPGDASTYDAATFDGELAQLLSEGATLGSSATAYCENPDVHCVSCAPCPSQEITIGGATWWATFCGSGAGGAAGRFIKAGTQECPSTGVEVWW